MPQPAVAGDAVRNSITVNLIDVGAKAYGDCILCQFGEISVLIDGAHPGDSVGSDGHRSVPDQLGEKLGQDPESLHVDLLIVTHTHADHYGCLPELVEAGGLKADWALVADRNLGWGIVEGGLDAAEPIDPNLMRAMDLFRDDGGQGDDPAESILDAARVPDQQVYQAFLDGLAANGTKVVQYNNGPDASVGLEDLLNRFAGLGLDIHLLGPSRNQLSECARALAKGLGLLRDSFQSALDADPGKALPVLLDAARKSRGGNFVNLQSIVTVFEYAGRKFLFSGDMQTEDTSSQFSPVKVTAELQAEVDQLRKAMIQPAPYDFVKLGHHGSFNACSDDLLTAYKGTIEFGICTGEFSKTHPDPTKVLPLLVARKNEIQWLRTDYNRLCGFTWSSSGRVEYFKEASSLNNSQKNKFDLGLRLHGAGGGGGGGDDQTAMVVERIKPSASAAQASAAMARFESTIPFGDGSVSIQFTVVPPPSHQAGSPGPGVQPVFTPSPAPPVAVAAGDRQPGAGFAVAAPVQPPNIGKGRRLPKLLFVTSADGLSGNIGREETAVLLKAIAAQGHLLLSDLPTGLTVNDTSNAVQQVRKKIASQQGIEGVVLLGGCDVIPSRQLNTLPEGEEQAVSEIDDPDRWIVWCDDEYAATETNDQVQYYSLPISRVPDQHDARSLSRSLEAQLPAGNNCSGIRNLKRPFAAKISPAFKDGAPLLISAPVSASAGYDLTAAAIYLMLHGSAVNSMEFDGENAARQLIRAFRIDKVPDTPGCVVLAGCCWGALTAAVPAAFASGSAPIGVKGRDTSIALRFLAEGARGFVGCTGAHYSPVNGQPPESAGGAMHAYFWRNFFAAAVRGPAEALQLAKREYVNKMPHVQDLASSLAVDSKTLHQFTCLGLGW